MHREDNSKYLLYIEPKSMNKLSEPIDDELTQIMDMALSKSKIGTSSYSNLDDIEGRFRENSAFKGSHMTECGERSSNKDYLLENGMITNSLASFYLRWYRFDIPEIEMNKVHELVKFYKIK
jgi:hypothetical protein